MIVRRLGPEDAEAFAELRMAGLRERPDAFGSSPEEDGAADVDFTRRRLAPELEHATFGAFDTRGGAETLVGVVGLNRDGHRKARHHAGVWGMYVAPSSRGRGVGTALLEALITYARSLPDLEWLQLGVGMHNEEARGLYQAHGFVPWGVERDALRFDGRSVDELRMRLRLAGTQPDAPRTDGSPTLRGHCLCEGVRFEVAEVVGPLELCHCPRCRRVSGSAFVAGLMVSTHGYRMTAGRELVRRFTLPVREVPPPYATFFCERCGSPVPNPEPEGEQFEVPAGLLEGDPGMRADRHIFVEHRAPWFEAGATLPEFDRAALIRLRFGESRGNGRGQAEDDDGS